MCVRFMGDSMSDVLSSLAVVNMALVYNLALSSLLMYSDLCSLA